MNMLANWVDNTGKVIAFEASPHNSAILRKHIELDRLSQVRKQCHRRATEHRALDGRSNTRVTRSQDLGESDEATHIGHYLDEKSTFVKIDIEGFEVKALKGVQRVLAFPP